MSENDDYDDGDDGDDYDRLKWLEEAIKLSEAWATEREAGGRVEWMFSRNDPLDMDIAHGAISAGKQAAETVKALKAERDAMLADEAYMDRRQADGDYED